MLTQEAGQSVIEAYLPRTLIDRWARHPASGAVWSEELQGCLMLCDMSGFTAMSERLARLGNEGAELMAGILNDFFTRMLGIAEGWGGVQMKFGGDAMLLFFGGEAPERRAAACALEMQGAMPEFQSVSAGGELHALRMRIGMHTGRFFCASAGEPEGALHYLLMGADVSATAATEGRASPGQVVASVPCAERLHAAGARLAAAPAGCSRVLRIDAERPPPEPPARADDAVLLRYVMPPLAARLAEGVARPVAEHRRVTAVFINLLGVAEILAETGHAAALEQVDAYVKLVLRTAQRHGGFLAASDAAEHGDKLIVLFGAPVSSERDEVSAMHFAAELQRELVPAGLALRHRVGMATGSVFAGEIGSPARREYTVIGDTVNLAARLMAAAQAGEVYVSAATAERAHTEFDLRSLRPLHLKGKAEPVRAFRLAGARLPERASRSSAPVFGRDREIAQMTALAAHARDEAGAWAYVCGDPGIGKSTIMLRAAELLEHDGWRWIATRCQAQQSGSVLAAWAQLLRQLLSLDEREDPHEQWRRLRDAVATTQPARAAFAPLIADLLGLPSERDAMLDFLDARRKRTLLDETIAGVVRAAARTRPLLLTFDDLHAADASSRELLAQFVSRPARGCLVLATARGSALSPELADARPDVMLALAELPAEAARTIATAAGATDPGVVEAIVARAQGNPMFVEELSRSASDAGGALPLTINEVILARLDRLPAGERSVLRTASVAGVSFAADHIAALIGGGLARPDVARGLAGLVDRGFLRRADDDGASHAFAHVLTQEVVYETLLYADRRRLHGALGGIIEREHDHDPGPVAGTLLHHFDRAQDAPKTVTYGVMTGERAARVFANREAMDYYTRALDALQRLPGAHEADRSVLLERIGECLEMDGRHRAATEGFSDALTAWRARGRRRAPPTVARDVAADRVREAALCRRIAVSYERRSEYDASLEWLDEAQARLPARNVVVGSQVQASRGMALFRKGQYAAAIVAGRRALSLARRARDQRSVAYAQNMLANSYLEEGSVRQAIRQLQQAIAAYEAMGDVYGTAAANNNIGNCYQAIGDLDAALRHYEIALQANLRAGNDGAIAHNNIGEALLMRGSLREAVIHLNEVVRAHEADAELAAVAGLSHVNLSRCMAALGDLAAAEDHLRAGTRLLTGVGAEALLLEAQLQSAALKLARGHPKAALDQATAVSRAAAAHDAKLLSVSSERVIGGALAALGRSEQAAERLRDGARLARRIGAKYEEAQLLIALAGALPGDRAGRARAAAHLRRARRILPTGDDPAFLREAREVVS